MWLAMIALLALLIWAVYALVTGITRRPGQNEHGGQRQPGDARRILDERLARGEIDTGEGVPAAARRARRRQRAQHGWNPGPAVTAAPEIAPEARRPRPARGYASGKEDYLRRLRKIEGQVRGLQRMIEADTWCPDVVTQVASATRALQEVAVGLLSDPIAPYVTATAAHSPDDAGARLAEVAATIRQVIRL